jgi:hypothetical protein
MNRHPKTIAALFVAFGITAPLVAVQEARPATPQTAVANPAVPPASQSASAASALTALLDKHKLEAIAARDPAVPGRVVAALYFPGSQLLVVSGSYPVPALLDKLLSDAKYMDVYLDVYGAANHQGQFFVMDLLADGLQRVCDRDQPFDSTSRSGGKSVPFDGNWAGQQLSEVEYNARFGEDDATYASILGVLAGAFTQSKSSPVAARKSGK